MTRESTTKTRRYPPAKTEPAPDPAPAEPDKALRELARRHCAAAIGALAAVVADAEAPAGARITAATTLLGWAFGRESGDGLGKGPATRKPTETEQVIRLAWMEPNGRNRRQAKKPKKSASKPSGGKTRR